MPAVLFFLIEAPPISAVFPQRRRCSIPSSLPQSTSMAELLSPTLHCSLLKYYFFLHFSNGIQYFESRFGLLYRSSDSLSTMSST